MIDYRAPVAAQLFAMHHGADAWRLPAWDDDLAAQVMTEAGRFVNAEIAPLDPIADAHHAVLVDGRVKLPKAFATAYRRYCEAGWPGLAATETHGGQGLPHVLAGGLSEMLSGACVTWQMILSLAQGAMRTIAANGTPEQCARYLPKLVSGEWLATMCLTEPQAGSDLGLIRTVATPQPDGSYRIDGGKIFISGGDQDMTDNIVHLVLARTPDAPPGVKGLSLFVAPAVLPVGRRNGIACVRVEEKMGMHASPTCQMAFEGAWAERLGGEGEGLARMFVMMNAERLDVGLQGVGLAEIAGQRARAYAAERRQGRDAAGPCVISRHADVRRMLLTQMALTEGCRALLYRTLVELDLGANSDLVDFLTPVCKAFATDAAIEAAQLGIQVHGGYGYLREYRAEQILRDARITPVYEGTNGIQAQTLADRLLRLRGGALVGAFRAEMRAAVALAVPHTAAALTGALDAFERAVAVLLARPFAGAVATSFMRLTGLLAVGGVWARLERAAEHAPSPARVQAAAEFFRVGLLSECGHLAERVVAGLELERYGDDVFSAAP